MIISSLFQSRGVSVTLTLGRAGSYCLCNEDRPGEKEKAFFSLLSHKDQLSLHEEDLVTVASLLIQTCKETQTSAKIPRFLQLECKPVY